LAVSGVPYDELISWGVQILPCARYAGAGIFHTTRRIRMGESITLVGLMLQALKHVPVQEIFDRDPYESRRTALSVSCLKRGGVRFCVE